MSAAPRVALITGANRGLGLELARQLASADSQLTVLMGARDLTRGSDSAKALGLANVVPLAIDVTSPASVAAAAKEVASRYGHLDLLVNNAAVAIVPTDESGTAAAIDETLAPNYYGLKDCYQAFLPLIKPNGRVVNVSSEMGLLALSNMSAENRAAFEKPDITVAEVDALLSSYRSACVATGGPAAGWPKGVYSLSKAAVTSLTRALAKDAPNGVTVNAVCPGWCQTDMTKGMPAPRTATEGATALARVCNLPADDRTTGHFFPSSQP